jgi:hypothetical protein
METLTTFTDSGSWPLIFNSNFNEALRDYALSILAKAGDPPDDEAERQDL